MVWPEYWMNSLDFRMKSTRRVNKKYMERQCHNAVLIRNQSGFVFGMADLTLISSNHDNREQTHRLVRVVTSLRAITSGSLLDWALV